MKTKQTEDAANQLVANLAWEYCEEIKEGQYVRISDYLERLPDQASRRVFKALVNTDMLLRAAFQVVGNRRVASGPSSKRTDEFTVAD